jgi:iron complex transport system permease protein
MEHSVSTDGSKSLAADYRRSILRNIAFIVILTLSTFIVMCFACSLGPRAIPVERIPSIIWNHLSGVIYSHGSSEWWDDTVIWNTRMPRIVTAVIGGGSLAICGAAMQSIFNNPMASPYTTGISSGACFGIVVAIVSGLSLGSALGLYGITANAFICGMIPVIVILVVAKINNMSPVTLILTGVAVSYFFGSLTTLVLVGATEDDLSVAYDWQVGTLHNITWNAFPLMFTMLILGSIILMLCSRQLNILTLGDDSAKTMGIDTEKFRLLTMALLALMTVSVVCYTGIIGFVGLIAPHMVRMVLGANNRYVLPASIFCGALLLLTSDTIARMIVSEYVPVGAVMAFIGGPIFLYLTLRKNSFSGAGF